MLIKFSISNSRSINKEVELSFIATEDEHLLEKNAVALPKYGINLLKTLALFGANASGKSNLLKAIADAYLFICEKRETYNVFNYCKNFAGNENKPVKYSFDILIEDKHYNYTFSHDKNTILEEKLSVSDDNKEEKLIYSRIKQNGKYDWQPSSFFEAENANYFYKSTPANKLFLSVANREVNADIVTKIAELETLYNWFSEQLIIHISLSAPGKTSFDNFITFILKSKSNKKIILKLIEIANIPIVDIDVIELTEIEGAAYRYTKPNGKDIYIKMITSHYDNQKAKFDFFSEESHGTQQFLAWLGSWLLLLQEGKQPKTFIIDELGNSLHPLLTQWIVKLFFSKRINPNNSQLLFTTHEVKLMDKGVMRPDQLYLVNHIKQSSTLRRTSDFKEVDKYNRLDNLYMHKGLTGVANINNEIDIDELLK